MFLTDDHLHTHFSFDGEAVPEELCEIAIKNGLKEITITDHMDIYSDRPYTAVLDCENWYARINELKERFHGRLMVHTGIELGQPQCHPEEAKAFLSRYKLDFILGSIHNLENDLDVYYCDFNQVDYKVIYARYIEWLLEMAKSYDFDIMGHVTYPSRYIYTQTGIWPDMKLFWEQYTQLFKILVQSGKGIELNLSGIARGQGKTMPESDLLKLYKECKGELITIGSDAHVSNQAGTVSALGQEMLKEAGFKYINYYEERKPQFIRL